MPPTPPALTTELDIKTLLLDPTKREIEPRIGSIGCSIARVTGVNEQERTVTALVSTPNADRYEEIVEAEAFKKWLPVFMSNPVAVAGHTYVGWAGEATVIGHWVEVKITKQGIEATMMFAETELAKDYWLLYKDGHMRAFSVGWITHEWKMMELEVAPGIKKRIRVFTEVELIEISAVAIPANRESLVRAASALSAKRSGPDPSQNEGEREALGLHISQLVTNAIEKLLTDPNGPIATSMIPDVIDAYRDGCGHGGSCHHIDDVETQAQGETASTPGDEKGVQNLAEQLEEISKTVS